MKKITLVGGTHGNELTGVYLVKEGPVFKDSDLELSFHVANPDAVQAGKRYIEKDLNRCFLPEVLAKSPQEQNLEEKRAVYLKKLLQNQDFIIDLHTTTANMGPTLIIHQESEFLFDLARYVTEKLPEVKTIGLILPPQKNPYLCTCANLGITIEIGPVSWGILKEDIYFKTKLVIGHILDYLQAPSKNPPKRPFTFYEVKETIDFPRNEDGLLTGMIHHELQGLDFQKILPGMPIFKTFSGETIAYQGPPAYPIFINEAAYYEKSQALTLTEKKVLS